MQTMNISLPDQLKQFVDDQVGSGRFSSVSEYVRGLIREDEKRQSQERLESLLLEGVRSGKPTRMTKREWAEIRRDGMKLLETQKVRAKG